jgi:DNA-binding NtrC family response regulator
MSASLSPRLLIVDDEASIAYAMVRYFQLNGWEVESTAELAEAQALVLHETFDVVLTDVKLTSAHGAEGLEMASFTHEYSPGTKVVVLTAFLTEGMRAEAYSRHASLVLRKPVPLHELAEMVFNLLGH